MTNVLIIEDNKENLNLMSYLLTNQGYTLFTATDGEQGLQICYKESLDLIICDIQIPKIDGMEVIRRLKSKSSPYRQIPIVAITAYAMVGDREKILMSGCNGYISKPIQPEIFISQLELYLPTDKQLTAENILAVPEVTIEEVEEIPEASRGTILVVDDNHTDRYLSEILLRSIGFNPILAESVEEALEKIEQERPHLILSDYHLQGKNGVDLFNHVKNHQDYKNIPFILISSTLPMETGSKILTTHNMDDFISRPIEPQLFIEAIEKIWQKKPPQTDITLN